MTPSAETTNLAQEIAKNPVLRRMRTAALLGIFAFPTLFFTIEYLLFHINGTEIPPTQGYLTFIICSLLFLYSIRTAVKWWNPPRHSLMHSNSLSIFVGYLSRARWRILILAGCLDDEYFTADCMRDAIIKVLKKGVTIDIVWGSSHDDRRYPDGKQLPKILSEDWARGITFYQLPSHTDHEVVLIDRHIYRYKKGPCRHDSAGKRKPEYKKSELDGVFVFNESIGYLWCRFLYSRFRHKAQRLMLKEPGE